MSYHTEQLEHGGARRPVDVDVICRWALDATASSAAERIVYRPQRRGDRDGFWDAASVARAVSLLLDEALAGTAPEHRVELSFRVHPREAIVRIHDPRTYGPGDRLGSLFDTDDERLGESSRAVREGIRAACDELTRGGGTLARVRTARGSTWVVTLPRAPEPAVVRAPQPATPRLRVVRSGAPGTR